MAGCVEEFVGESCPDGDLGSASGEWVTAGGTAGYASATDAGGFEAAPETRWCPDGEGSVRSLLLAGGRPVALVRTGSIGDRTYRLEGWRTADGSTQWRRRLPSDPIRAPVLGAGGVHLTMENEDRDLLARYAIGDGSEEWTVEPDSRATDSMPAVAAGTVDPVDVSGGVHAFEAERGTERWSTSVAEGFDPAARGNVPSVADGTVYLDAAIGQGPAALDAADGAVRWQRDVPGFESPVVDGDVLLGDDEEATYALEPETGETRWRIEEPLPTRAPSDGTFYTARGEEIRPHETTDGSGRWSRPRPDALEEVTAAVAADATVLVGGRSAVAGLDRASGSERRVVDTEDDVFGLAVAENGVFTFDRGGRCSRKAAEGDSRGPAAGAYRVVNSSRRGAGPAQRLSTRTNRRTRRSCSPRCSSASCWSTRDTRGTPRSR